MKPYYEHAGITLYHGDCREAMAALPDASVDAVVTDPPYGLSFMGKRWDCDVPSVEIWQQALRVLKPGGHLLAFAGTRTQHRMAVRIEDAGFEIRDMIAWVYGSGFPKSLDVSKAIDRAAGAEREVVGVNQSAVRKPKRDTNWTGDVWGDNGATITAPATGAARQWSGWGTALKPALEPITVARKPLSGTVAVNVLQYGTGGMNVDGCRVGTSKNVPASVSKHKVATVYNGGWNNGGTPGVGGHDPNLGRWPANLIHDGSDEVVGLFPETSPAKQADRGKGIDGATFKHASGAKSGVRGHDDAGGSAARFFYTAKADKSDRGASNNHPTVKPVDLMRYLVRLVCPMGGIVLDPFNGSGTTAVASRAEHCRYIGAELNEDYCRITIERLAQGVLF